MNIKFNRISILAALALTAAAFAATDGLSVKRTAKEGQTHKYKMDGKLTASIGDMSIVGTSSEKVTKVEANGNYTIEQTQLDGKVTFSGGEQDLTGQPPSVTTYMPDGSIVSVSGTQDDAAGMRMAQLGVLFDPGKPLAVGDKWSYEVKADAAKNILAGKADYQILGEEKVGTVDTIKLSANYKETAGTDPASSESTEWIDKADGSLVKLETKWTNAPSPVGPMSANIKINRID